jgi:hypothetical protein
MANEPKLVQALAGHLADGLAGLAGGAASIVWNVNDRNVVGSRALALSQVRKILVESKRVFTYDGNVVFEQRGRPGGRRLVTLARGDGLVRAGPSRARVGVLAIAVAGRPVPGSHPS